MISGIKEAIKESLILKGFIGLMMISFGVWGVGDFIGTGALDPSIAIRVGPSEISTTEFQRRFDQELNRFKEEVGQQAARSDALKRSIANSIVQDFTQTATVSAAAQELGIVIPLQRLQSSLMQEEAFQNSTGMFDQSRFIDVLYQNNLTEAQFVDMFSSDLRRSTIISPVSANAGAPEYLVDNLFAFRNETRSADTLLITVPSLSAEDLPTDQELEALYQQNITSYTAPEFRKVTALVIDASHFANPESISEEEVLARYEETRDRYRKPGTSVVSQMIFDTQDEAADARAHVSEGESLADLEAKADVPAAVNMGELSPASPVIAMMGEAYNLPTGEVSQPVQTDLGWHLFEVTSRTEESVIPFEDVKDSIREAMQEERGMDAVYEASVDIEDAVAGGTPLKEIAGYVGGDITEIEAMDRNGKNARGVDVPNIIDRANFIPTAFSTPEGEASQLLETPARTGYYIIQVDSVTPPTPRTLEEVRSQVVNLWERQTRNEKAKELADSIQAEIGPSVKLSELAAKHDNVSYAPLGPITRFGEGLEQGHIVDSKLISPAVLDEMFSAKVGAVISAPVSEGMVIARLSEINEPKPEGQLATSQVQLRASVINTMREDLATQVVQAFAARYPVEINNEIIDQTISLR